MSSSCVAKHRFASVLKLAVLSYFENRLLCPAPVFIACLLDQGHVIKQEGWQDYCPFHYLFIPLNLKQMAELVSKFLVGVSEENPDSYSG